MSLSSTAIFLMAQRFCHPLLKKNRGGFGSGRSPVLRNIGCYVHPVPNPFPGLPAVPSLVPHTELALGTEVSQGLCSALSRLGAGAGMLSPRAAGMGHSVQLSTPTLHSCSQHRFFSGCWTQNYSYSSIRLFEKALSAMVELL